MGVVGVGVEVVEVVGALVAGVGGRVVVVGVGAAAAHRLSAQCRIY